MQIKPLHQATREDITEMARAAAERPEPVEQANPFESDTPNHRAFCLDYYQHMLALSEPVETEEMAA